MTSEKRQTAKDQAIGCVVLIVFGFTIYNFGGIFFGKSAAELGRDADKQAAERKAGFHCLSGLDGSHRGIVSALKPTLRNPESFQHVETKITPVNAKGQHVLTMSYRAENGFGGLAFGNLVATVSNKDCTFQIVSNVTN